MPEGSTVVFSAHGVSPAVHARGRRAQPQDDRRDLPARDQGAQRGPPVRRRRLRHPAHRPRGPRGGRGHRRARRRATSRWCRAPTTSPTSRSATPPRSPGSRRRRLSVDETMETVDRIRAAVPEPARPAVGRHLLRDPEPPAGGQGDRQGRRPRARRRLGQLQQLGAPRRGRARVRRQGGLPGRRRVARSTRPGSRASSRSASPRGRRCRRTSSTACSTSSPRAATRPPGRCTRPRSR